MNKDQIDKSMEALNSIMETCATTIFTDQMDANTCVDIAYKAFGKIEDDADKVRTILMRLGA